MAAPADLLVLARALEPSDELGSTLELLSWIRATRPEVAVRLVATHGGAWTDRAGAVATVTVTDETLAGTAAHTLLKVGAAPVARVARSAELRRELRAGSAPVLVEASAGGLLNWLEAGADRVVAHVHRAGPSLDDLPEQDRTALTSRATHWADGMDLVPQGADRDDRPGIVARCRTAVDARLGLAAGAPLVVLGAAPHDVLPPDDLLGLVWALVEAHRGLRVTWTTGALQPRAREVLARLVADAGLHEVITPVEAAGDLWRTVAAADALVVHHDPAGAGGLGALAAQIAPHRTLAWGVGGPSDVPEAGAVAAVLPGGPAWAPTAEDWHAATGGPAWLRLLGIDPPIA